MILTISIIIGILFIGCAFWIWSIKPNKITEERRCKMKPFEESLIAHRGLFSNRKGGIDEDEPPVAPENTLEAFRRAVEAGYGIEMDVQLTKDDKLVVFHDGNLKRACGLHKNVLDFTYDELKEFRVFKSQQKIPLFEEVRDLVNGKVPLLIEVKPEGNSRKTCAILNDQLKDYEGVYCMESFDPRAVRWYRKHRPDVLRGQLSERFPKADRIRISVGHFFLASLFLNFLGRPDFIAYNHKHKNQFSYRLLRKLYPVMNAAWTIRSQKQLENAKDVFGVFIFDSFIPEK